MKYFAVEIRIGMWVVFFFFLKKKEVGESWPEFKTLRMQLNVPTVSTPKEEAGICITLARVLEMCANKRWICCKKKIFH